MEVIYRCRSIIFSIIKIGVREAVVDIEGKSDSFIEELKGELKIDDTQSTIAYRAYVGYICDYRIYVGTNMLVNCRNPRKHKLHIGNV